MPDSALILAAYRSWGERCPERLIGDFAFAVWDVGGRTLFLARDHMGVRPLVYFRSGSLFAFASQERALLALSEVPRRLDEVAVGDFLLAVLEDTERTFYEGVRRLPPHHAMSVTAEGGSARVRSYWSLDASRELRLGSDAEYEEAFRSTFLEAVRCRLRSAGPVATELSGGLDSSAVTCAARDLTGPIQAFSIVFDEPGSDERRYVDAVLAGEGRQRVDGARLTADDLLALSLDDLLAPQDGPFASLTVLMETALCRRVAGSGARVLLGGFDGDVVVSYGLERLSHLLKQGRWGTLRSEVSALAPRLGLSRWHAYRSCVLRPAAPLWARRLWRGLRDRSSSSVDASIEPAFAKRMRLNERIGELERARARARTPREEHRDELGSGDLPAALEIRDRIAAAAGVEFRHPFFDVRLVELCLALPEDQKLRDGWTRSIARRALAGIVPEEVLRRMDKGRINDALLVGLVHAERAELERLNETSWGPAGRFLEVTKLGPFRSFGGVDRLPGLWHTFALARWLRDSDLLGAEGRV